MEVGSTQQNTIYCVNWSQADSHIVEYEKAKRMTLKSYERQLQAVGSWSGVDGRLSSISAPTLVVHGDADALVPYGNGQFLSTHIAGARLVTYGQVGHLPPIETPERFNRDAMEFLNLSIGP